MKEDTQPNEITLEGVYGQFIITEKDRIEVKKYRISVLICGLSFFIGLIHWVVIGNLFSWIWLILMSISLAFSLHWIHIYLRPLHNTLKILWGIGSIGILIMCLSVGLNNILPTLRSEPYWTFAIGPMFAALTGLGFKEFFCFRRIEALGLTIFLPIALLGHISHLINPTIVFSLVTISSTFFLVLSIKKFGIDPAADIGDKSVFEYLERQRQEVIV